MAGTLPSEPSIKLNAMEAQWILVPLLQHLLLFEADHLPPFRRYPLVPLILPRDDPGHPRLARRRKLHYLADTGDVTICCSTGSGDGDGSVRFVATECDADVRRHVGDEDRDVLTFKRLVPELDMNLLSAPLLAVQAMRPVGSGVALGVSVHDTIADGPSL